MHKRPEGWGRVIIFEGIGESGGIIEGVGEIIGQYGGIILPIEQTIISPVDTAI